MNPEIGFVAALATTVALLVGGAVTGRRRIMRLHIPFVLSAVASLGVAIWFALKVGTLYDLEAAGRITPIHLGLAKVTTLLYVWPLSTGPLAYRGKIPLWIHRAGAWTALILTVVATITGIWMLALAERL